MSDSHSPIEALQAYRKLLVNQRRRAASTAIAPNVVNNAGTVYENYSGPNTNNVETLIEIQTRIEIVDRAIADEKRLALGTTDDD